MAAQLRMLDLVMKKAFEIALGVVTSIGGFLDAGAMATSIQAGARFRFQLIWATLLGTICAIFLVEMSGRLAAVSKHPLRELIHKRFGFNFSMLVLALNGILNLLVLASEVAGICMALELFSGVSFRWWAVPVATGAWLLLWLAGFGTIEKSLSLLGLVTGAFIIAAFLLHPPMSAMAKGALPRLPGHDAANYWYMAVSIIGSIVTPYIVFFYSSGAIEDKWDKEYIGVNRAVASLGMGFGAVIALGIMVVSAMVLAPRGVHVDNYHEAAPMLTTLWGWWGFLLFGLSLAVASLGAALEVALSMAYEIAQSFGWNWGKNQKPRHEARFSVSYSIELAVAAVPALLGLDPLKLTVFTMALACVVLPFATLPFLVLMNDKRYLGSHINRRWTNVVVAGIVTISFVLAVVAIPLQIAGG